MASQTSQSLSSRFSENLSQKQGGEQWKEMQMCSHTCVYATLPNFNLKHADVSTHMCIHYPPRTVKWNGLIFPPQTLIFHPNPVILVKDVCTVAFVSGGCLFEYLTIKTDLKFHKSTSCSELAVPKKEVTKNIAQAGIVARKHICQICSRQTQVLAIRTALKRRQTGEETKRKTVIKQGLGQARLPTGSRGAWNDETQGDQGEFWYFKGEVEP